jgi:predicted SAM-dependent methyltransferase
VLNRLRNDLVRLVKRARQLAIGGRLSRAHFAAAYLHGSGLEIGALHNPLILPRGVHVTYVDSHPVDELRLRYPELDGQRLVPVGVVDDATRLDGIAGESQDFVIANHVIEHCEDPIAALASFARVLRGEGIVYVAVPDKRFTFDRERPVTTVEHLVRDHREGPAVSREAHLEEWARLVIGVSDEAAVHDEVERLVAADVSIHFHVWNPGAWLEFMLAVGEEMGLNVEAFHAAHGEFLTVLKKRSPDTPEVAVRAPAHDG